MARTKNTDIKELHPRDPDAKYFGSEPFCKEGEPSKWNLGTALSWYGHFYDTKDAREFIAQYLDFNGELEKSKIARRVHESEVITTYGFVARCIMRGFTLTPEQFAKFEDEIKRMLKTVEVVQTADKVVVKSNRPNVQEIMREKTHEAGGELEGRWDDYINDGCKKENNINTVQVLTQHNILPQHINILIDAWKKKLDEYQELQAGKDEQLNEAYARFGKIQIRNIISTIESVIAELNSYINIKKNGRKPRTKKPVSVDKIVRSLKYLKTFKLDKLELVSVPPTKLHGCAEAWVYDTKKRKLHHYVADDYAKSLSVKGNTVIGFCTKQSEIKTLRKPETQIKEVMGSKPAARKFFKDIKAVSVTPNGRFNADMIILKAF
jgi:hypothetical protein